MLPSCPPAKNSATPQWLAPRIKLNWLKKHEQGADGPSAPSHLGKVLFQLPLENQPATYEPIKANWKATSHQRYCSQDISFYIQWLQQLDSLPRALGVTSERLTEALTGNEQSTAVLSTRSRYPTARWQGSRILAMVLAAGGDHLGVASHPHQGSGATCV